MAKKQRRTRVRDAKTGRFLPKGTDKRCPAPTVKETVRPRKHGVLSNLNDPGDTCKFG